MAFVQFLKKNRSQSRKKISKILLSINWSILTFLLCSTFTLWVNWFGLLLDWLLVQFISKGKAGVSNPHSEINT